MEHSPASHFPSVFHASNLSSPVVFTNNSFTFSDPPPPPPPLAPQPAPFFANFHPFPCELPSFFTCASPTFDLSQPFSNANKQHLQPAQLILPQSFFSSATWDNTIESGFCAELANSPPSPPLITANQNEGSCLESKAIGALSLPGILTQLADGPEHAKDTLPSFSIRSTTTTSADSCSEAISNSISSSSPVPQSTNDLVKASTKTEDRTTVKRSKLSAKDNIPTEIKQASKKRKAQQKRVVCVPAAGGSDRATGESVPSDSWAWRKYGQKPIKGSPYPRGYYRCSSSKGCPARKQVERSRTDPSMFVITYTSDHNHPWPTHRNALAGSTRQKALQKTTDTEITCAATEQQCERLEETLFSSLVDFPDIEADQIACPLPTCSMDEPFSLWRPSGIEDEDLFAALQELQDASTILGKPTSDDKSDDEGGTLLVDPYNLFSW